MSYNQSLRESFKESFKEFTKNEKKKFSELPGISKKLRYIWDYYRYWILIPIVVIAACWSIGTGIYNSFKYDQIFYCAVFHNSMSEETLASLTDGFGEYYGIDPESETMYIDTAYSLTDPDPQVTFAITQRLDAMISTRDVEIIMGDGASVSLYATDGFFYDLREILPPETYEALSEYMIEYTYTDTYDGTSTTAPYAIDLSQSDLVKNGSIYAEEPIAGIVINSENPDVAVKFIEYIFGL